MGGPSEVFLVVTPPSGMARAQVGGAPAGPWRTTSGRCSPESSRQVAPGRPGDSWGRQALPSAPFLQPRRRFGPGIPAPGSGPWPRGEHPCEGQFGCHSLGAGSSAATVGGRGSQGLEQQEQQVVMQKLWGIHGRTPRAAPLPPGRPRRERLGEPNPALEVGGSCAHGLGKAARRAVCRTLSLAARR